MKLGCSLLTALALLTASAGVSADNEPQALRDILGGDPVIPETQPYTDQSGLPGFDVPDGAMPADAAAPADSAAADAAGAAADEESRSKENPFSMEISLGRLGAPLGIELRAGHTTNGIDFTLPVDKIITSARMVLNIDVTTEMARRGVQLEMLLNNQPIAALPLTVGGGAVNRFEIDIPYENFSATNSLSFIINDEKLSCIIDHERLYVATVRADSELTLSGYQLQTEADLSIFPMPFFDSFDLTKCNINFVFPVSPDASLLSGATILASWFGNQADYRGTSFETFINSIPNGHAVVFGHPGQTIGAVTMPDTAGITAVQNPENAAFMLVLVCADSADEMRDAVYTLISQPHTVHERVNSYELMHFSIPQRNAYDAIKWIPTDRKVYLNELMHPGQSFVSAGVQHPSINLNFRAAPDLYHLYGEPADLFIRYRFPLDPWIDEQHSWLSVALSGSYSENLPVNKIGVLETLWRLSGGDGRQEFKHLQIQPYMIYGDNSLNLYFDLKLKPEAPCTTLHDNNLKSVIDDDSYIDLSNTSHYARLPNLSFFVGASFPFTKYADLSRTLIVMPAQPTPTEIKTLLDISARAGNSTGVPIYYHRLFLGTEELDRQPELAEGKDILAVCTTKQTQFLSRIVSGSAFHLTGTDLGVYNLTPFRADSDLVGSIKRLLNGDWRPENVDANRYLSSNVNWRGFISNVSPWDDHQVVVTVTASDDQELHMICDDLDNDFINRSIGGDVSIISGKDQIRSFRVGDSFYDGEVSTIFRILHFAGIHEIWLACIAFFLLFIFSLITSVWLKRRARKRINPEYSAKGK